MTQTPKQVPPSTRWILAIAIVVAMIVLLALAALFDEATEAGTAIERGFALLIGIVLGPTVLLVGLVALIRSGRALNRKTIPIALAAIAFGAIATWLFFIEASELPRLWPY